MVTGVTMTTCASSILRWKPELLSYAYDRRTGKESQSSNARAEAFSPVAELPLLAQGCLIRRLRNGSAYWGTPAANTGTGQAVGAAESVPKATSSGLNR